MCGFGRSGRIALFPTMSHSRRTHRRITFLTQYPLVLCLAVVLWGAAYKMEQYPERGLAFRVMPPAKLLTEKERPLRQGSAQTALARVSQHRRVGASPAGTAPASCPRTIPSRRERQLVPVDSIACGSPEFTYFCFRPPPVRSFS